MVSAQAPATDNGAAQSRPAGFRGSPVLLEFTADCKELEITVYRDPALMDAAMELDRRFLQVDMTYFNTTQKQLLERHGGHTLPYAVVFDR